MRELPLLSVPPNPESLDIFLMAIDRYRMHPHVIRTATNVLNGMLTEYELAAKEFNHGQSPQAIDNIWNAPSEQVSAMLKIMPALVADCIVA